MADAPSPQPNVAAAGGRAWFPPRVWAAAILGGVAAGLAGAGLMVLLRAVQAAAWGPGDDLFAVARHATAGHRVAVLAIAGAWVAAGTAAAGRLGPGGDAEAAVRSHAGRVPFVGTVARSVVSIVAVGLGMSLGREAGIKQAGGASAAWLAGRFGVSDDDRRMLVACGIGAGMAAAYNVPLGGAAFAVEVVLGTASLPVAVVAVVMSVAAVVTSWVALPTGPVYLVRSQPLTASGTFWAAACGPAFGLVAVAVVRATAWAGSVRPRGTAAAVAPVVVLSLLGCVAVAVPEVLGNGKEGVQLALDGRMGLAMLVALPALKLATTAGCLAGGGRGGLFTPTMMVGAVTGGLLGHLWATAWPGADPGRCAMIGSAAVLAAASQGPVSAVVVVLELTRHGEATMVPMLLAVAGATVVANRVDGRSIYSARARA